MVDSRRLAGRTLTVLGAAAMVIGSFLVWAQYSVAGGPNSVGIYMPLRSLYRPAVLNTDTPLTSPGTVVIVLAVIGVLGLERDGLITVLAGSLAGAVVAAVSIQISKGRVASIDTPFDAFGIGVYVIAVGCVLMVVGGLVRRTGTHRDDDSSRADTFMAFVFEILRERKRLQRRERRRLQRKEALVEETSKRDSANS
jgi:hypothetical protein